MTFLAVHQISNTDLHLEDNYAESRGCEAAHLVDLRLERRITIRLFLFSYYIYYEKSNFTTILSLTKKTIVLALNNIVQTKLALKHNKTIQ